MSVQNTSTEHDDRESARTPRTGPLTSDDSRLSGRTTRQWLLIGVSASLVVLTGLGVLGYLVLAHGSKVNNHLVDGSWPALVTAVRLQDSLVNQETGIRGYALSGQSAFLQPYNQGLADEKADLATLRPLIAADPTAVADLNLFLTRAAAWQRQTAQPIAATPPGAPVSLAVTQATEDKAAFDSLRAAAATQQQHLKAELVSSQTDLQSVRTQRNVVFTAIAVVVLLLAALVFEGLRRGVTLPLERLSGDARRVAGGDFTHPIAESGPADLRELARVVEAMRERLADELSFTDEARR
jgi:CHASE3 domain sensor protein